MATIDTNLNQAPYFSDYDPAKQHYQIPFKPGTAVQARELNNVQGMLLNQISRVGDNLFIPGTIINGCGISTNPTVPYVKVADTYANGNPLYPNDLIGNYVQSNSGLTAIVTNARDGLVSLSPALNTLYIAYINSAVNVSTSAIIKEFIPDEYLTVFNSSNVAIAALYVANDAVSGSSNTTGYGYLFGVDDGVIYQKGMMLDVKSQSLFIEPYSSTPNNLSVGFTSVESIVTSYQDETLLDNAQGAPNEFAPGADRLKIVPTLTLVNSATVNTSSNLNNFFSICDFVNGAPSVVNQNTVYAAIGDKMADLSYETNGDFIIKPFNLRTVQLVQNGVSNTQLMRLEVDPGSAHVDGYKVNLVGQLLGSLKLGTDYAQVNTGIVSYSMGDYMTLNEVAGNFDSTALVTLTLKDAPQYAVSNGLAKGISPDTFVVTGNTIGTASLYAFTPATGTPSQSDATFYAYIFNLHMQGLSFQRVRSIVATSGGHTAIADLVLENGAAVIQNPAYSSKIFPFMQKAIKSLVTASNTTDTQFQYTGKSSVVFSTTGNATITVPTYAGGQNEFAFGAGTLDTRTLSNITLVSQSNVHTANLSGSISATSSCTTITGVTTAFNTSNSLHVGSFITLANTTATETRQVSLITNSTNMSVTKPFSSSWTSVNAYVSYMIGDIVPLSQANVSVNVANSTSMTMTFPGALNASMSAIVYYPVLRVSAKPALKHRQAKVYAKIDMSNNVFGTTGPWCLGIPDVISVNHIWLGTTYSNTNPDYRDYFRLDDGQRNSSYDLAALTNLGAPVSSSTKLLVEFDAYIPDFSTGAGFFTVDSYPVDDTGVTANSITTSQFQYFIGDHTSYRSLRNTMDFRVYESNSIPYVTNVATAIGSTAIINAANAGVYQVNGVNPVIPDALVETSYQYYMGRYDKIGMSHSTTLIIEPGLPAENPLPGADVKGGMTLATIYIPPYPSLTPDIVDYRDNPYAEVTSITYKKNTRYRMEDIGKIDSRLKQVEYYTSLSVLEQSAQNLLLTNQAGTTRFQNGILVDPMGDFSIANTKDPAFNIAIDSVNSVARPVFNQQLVDLMPMTLTNAVQNGRLISLPFSTIYPPIATQPFASKERNCAQYRQYVWQGKLTLNPPGDYQPDVTINPAVVVNVDDYSNWTNLANAWSTQWGTWAEIGATSTQTVGTNTNGPTTTTTTSTTTSTSYSQTGNTIALNPQYNSYTFGQVVTGLDIQPYARQNYIQYEAHSLRPSTQVYLYVNDLKLETYGSMKTYTSNDYTTLTGKSGQMLMTDETGSIYGEFRLPGHTFYTGTLNVQLLDVANTVISSDVITTMATAQYFADNLSYTKNALNLNTIEPTISFNTVSRTQVINTVSVNVSSTTIQQPVTINNQPYVQVINQPFTSPTFGGPGGAAAGNDPIGQSFSVPSAVIQPGIEGFYVSYLDVYFSRKDPTLGITIRIQPLSNGTIDNVVLPFSQVHLTPSQILTSADSSVATRVTFPSPVFLGVDQFYAFIMAPDGSNPNYSTWAAAISGKDLLTHQPIFTFSTLGDMFLSSQSFTWTAYGTENIKFSLYANYFNKNSGNVLFCNKDYEYIALTGGLVKGFYPGETVWFNDDTGNFLANNQANVNSQSHVLYVPDTSNLSTDIYLGLYSNVVQNSCVVQIQSVINSTAVMLRQYPSFTYANSSARRVNFVMRGKVISSNLTHLIAENPKSNTLIYLSTNNYIFGQDSGAYAEGMLYDVLYSTLCPKISAAVPVECGVDYTVRVTSNAYGLAPTWTSVVPGLNTAYPYEYAVASKSNENRYMAGQKSLVINAAMSTSTFWLSPMIDTAKLGVVTVHNLINNEAANNMMYFSEMSNLGNAINKYISTTVTLAPGLDAEDLTVYIGAYWPPGTTIYVYSKIENQYDIDSFDSKAWSPMFTKSSVFSSAVNDQDYNEYIFSYPTANVAPTTAFIDQANSDTVGYYSSNGQLFETFNKFAVKIVLLSDSTATVPLITDFRAVCTSSGA